MKTLFVHPYDPSTEFLHIVYDRHANNSDVTIINGEKLNKIKRKDFIKAIKDNDRIVFMGHGTEYGLLDMIRKRYVITPNEVQFIKDKEVICYWCNANIFVEKYDLNAFSTGMFVSEIDEAKWYNLPTEQELIDESNTLFCKTLSSCIFDSLEIIHDRINNEYIGDNPIIKFNRECMGI